MNDNHAALQFHQLDLDISSNEDELNFQGQIRALRNLGSTYEAMGQLEEAIQLHERQLAVSTQNDDILGKAEALNCLGKTPPPLYQNQIVLKLKYIVWI